MPPLHLPGRFRGVGVLIVASPHLAHRFLGVAWLIVTSGLSPSAATAQLLLHAASMVAVHRCGETRATVRDALMSLARFRVSGGACPWWRCRLRRHACEGAQRTYMPGSAGP
eukprot:260766-Chlamydomonas_euryale.AAC.1